MSYLLIENRGELDISSLVLLGASTKRNDSSKIGFFGSGNKYAIATLIRYNIPFKIFSGEREIEITTEDVTFRDVKFKKIIIDGQATSLTTDMGPQWEPWMAVREWVSNSIDEGSHKVVNRTDNLFGRSGATRFFVQNHPMIMDVIDNWDVYFTFDREDAIFSNTNGKIFPQTNKDGNLILYRKGIRVYFDEGLKSLYQYDVDTYEINESRIIESIHTAEYRTIKFLSTVQDVKIAKNILTNAFVNNTWESRLPWRWGIGNLDAIWKEAIGKRVIIIDSVAGYFMDIQETTPHYIVSIEMAQQIRKSFPDVRIYGMDEDGASIGYKPVETNPKQEFLLKEAVKFCEETQYSIDYPIEIVEFEERAVLGRAHDGKILLSNRVFDEGKKKIVLVLIEENEHLKTGYKDMTRAFQSHLFNLFLTEKESRFGYFL